MHPSFLEAEVRARHAQIARAARSGPGRIHFARLRAFVQGLQRPEIAPCPGLSTC